MGSLQEACGVHRACAILSREKEARRLVANKIDLRQPCTIFLRILGLRVALAGGLHGHQMDRQAQARF
jgi:hypothetical protein